MKRRLGYILLVLLTVAILKMISLSLGWMNISSDAAFFFGLSTIGTIVVISPWLYCKVWDKMIKSTVSPVVAVGPSKEKKNEV